MNDTGKPTQPPQSEGSKAASSWLSVAVDYGPLLAFLAAYRLLSPDTDGIEDDLVIAALTTKAIVQSTGVFIVAALVALGVSKWRLGRISPMLWFSTALIVVFGGFTIWTGDQRIIQLKPTVLYALFGIALLVGWQMGRALLKILLEAAFEGL
ncbi:MAG: septation protein IspZ, partial [Erythrobacter sp.]|nr:septation protein IspZ [Erythrobacter sp.]